MSFKKKQGSIEKLKRDVRQRKNRSQKANKESRHKLFSHFDHSDSRFSFNNWSHEVNEILIILGTVIKKKIKSKIINFTFRSFLTSLFLKNIKIKILSILIAFSLYGYVKMQDIEERSILIRLEVMKNEDLAFVANPPENITLFLSGTRNILGEIDVNQIRGRIDLTDIEKEGIYKRSPNIEGVPSSVQILNYTPREIQFQLSSLERKLLPIEPELVGNPNPEFEVKSFKTSPRKIWVFGPKDILEDITKLTTEPISITGLKVGKETEVELSKNIHPNIKVDISRKIKVNIFIQSKYYKEDLKEAIYPLSVNFLEKSQLISYDYIGISNVKYQILVEESENFDPDEQINFYVNTKKINFSGVYNLVVRYEKVEGLKITDFAPKKVEITVEKKLDDDTLEASGSDQNLSLTNDFGD